MPGRSLYTEDEIRTMSDKDLVHRLMSSMLSAGAATTEALEAELKRRGII